MRVLVASGPFEGLTPARTGAAVARAWAGLGAQCAVVPLGECGHGFGQAWSALHERRGAAHVPVHVTTPDPDGVPSQTDAASSWSVGRALAQLLVDEPGPAEVALEVDGHAWHDGGAGFLAALGATADRPLDRGVTALSGITTVNLEAVRGLVGATRVQLVTTAAEQALQLTGLRGITAARGHARGEHPGTMLATDQALVDLAAACGAPDLATLPGAGALGGLGFAVTALGGEVLTGPQACARAAGLENSVQQADLVVVCYDELHFGTKGGDLLPLVVDMAQAAMRPVVAVARRNWISARELRTMGVEEAYGLLPPGDVAVEDELTRAAAAVARTWSW